MTTPRAEPMIVCALALVGSAGCRPDKPAKVDPLRTEACWSLRTEDDLPSMTQTYDVAVDSARGRAVATGLGLPYLSVIDLATGTRVDAIPYATRSTTYPRVAVDGAGTAWVASISAPALIHVALDTRAVTPIAGVPEARWVVGLDEGVLVPRSSRAETPGVTRYDGAGEVVADVDLTAARAAAAHPDGVVVLGDAEAVVLDGGVGADALAVLARCDLPFAADRVAALDDGTLILADATRVGRVQCGDDDAVGEVWPVGVEITDVATDGARAWALDRIGAEDPTAGVAWSIGADGAPALAFPTGKNTGYGEVDAATGTLWANAEGTAEVHGYAVADGTRVATVSTGTFVDGLVLAPDGALVATGRLSGLLARLDGDELTRGAPVRWPWSPLGVGDDVWMLGQLDGTLASVDAATLDARVTVDLGAGPNPLLTFSGLAFAEDRGTVLVAESNADVLLELDAAGAEVGRWALGGPAVDDPDMGAHLEVLYRDGVAWLTRTSDGRLQRLDLATGARVDARLDADRLATLQDRRRTHALAWDGVRPRLGPYGLDADTLDVVDAWDDVAALLAPWPDGGWLALDAAGTSLLRLDAEGATQAVRPWFDERQPGTLAVTTPDGGTAWVNRAYEGSVCEVPLGSFAE